MSIFENGFQSPYNSDPADRRAAEERAHKQMKKIGKIVGIVVIAFLLLIVIFQCFYTVDETQHAIKYRFSEIIEVNVNNLTDEEYQSLLDSETYQTVKLLRGAGLRFKMPFVDKIEKYDNRLITYNTMPREVITSDKKKIILDNNAQWWIIDPVKFKITMNSINSANKRIEDLMYSKMNEKVGRTTSKDLISNKEYVIAMLEENTNELNNTMGEYGMKVADIQIKRTDLPTENNENIFNRMRTEREQMARQYRSEGKEEAQKIKSEADREAAKLRAEANAEAQRVRGQGDADAADIFNKAYNKDIEFYKFYKTLETYKTTIKDSGAKIVISPDSDFAKYIYNDQTGAPIPPAAPADQPITVIP